MDLEGWGCFQTLHMEQKAEGGDFKPSAVDAEALTTPHGYKGPRQLRLLMVSGNWPLQVDMDSRYVELRRAPAVLLWIQRAGDTGRD